MNPATLLYVINLLETLPQLINAGVNISTLIQQTSASLRSMQAEKRDPTAEEWVAQAQVISTLRSQLHAPPG